MEFIVGCDADGILTDLSTHNIRAGKKYFKRKPVNPNAYSLEELFDLDDIPRFIQYAIAFRIYVKYCKNEAPRENASNVITKLTENGFVFHSITARKFATNNDLLGVFARSWFKKWLRKNSINFASINYCFEERSPEEKLFICKKMGVDVMIEDKSDVAMKLAESGVDVIMIDAPYNLDTIHQRIYHVKDWSNVRNTLIALKHNKNTNYEFVKKSIDEIQAFSDSQKMEYYSAYKRYLKNTWFDEERFKKNDKRFKFIFSVLKLPIKLRYRVKVFGKENIPFQNGFIIASNHCDSTDQYKIGLALGNRPFVGYAAKEIENTFRGRLFRFTGLGVFIDRNDPISKKGAEERLLTYIAHSRTALIFPEGTRKNKDAEGRMKFQNRFKIGTVVLAQRTGTAILPVATNTFANDTIVRFGELLYVDPIDDLDIVNRKLEKIIANMSYENICCYFKSKKVIDKLSIETDKYNEYLDEITK